MWNSLTGKLFLEVVLKRKSNSWEVRIFKSIVRDIFKSMRDCPNANNAEYWMATDEFSLDNTE